MIDSHCHIGLNQTDITDLLLRAQAAGVTNMLSVACSVPEYPALLKLLDTYPMVYGAFGVHPEYADTMPDDADVIQKLTAHSHLVAVGECGLDYHYTPETKDIQRKVFEKHIELAHQLNMPLIIHTREADEDTIAILESADRAGWLSMGGVLHCFTGSERLAKKGLTCGLYISASGVITIKMADEVRRVFQLIPLNRLLIETDSPYMAPVPYRGKINEPSYLPKTAEKLAELKGVSLQEIEQITDHNFQVLFHITKGE